jgi:hypothetical protein
MAHKLFTVGGIGQQPGLDDVVKVALGNQITLDSAGAERIKRESPPPKSFEAEPDSQVCASSQPCLNREQCRAVLITRLLSLVSGKSGIRLQLVEYLTDLLNKDIIPALPASDDIAALSAVADACKGLGKCLSAAQPQDLSDHLPAARVPVPGISAAERAAVTAGAAASAGVGSLVIVGARQLLASVTAVAALSCEAAGAQVSLNALQQAASARRGCCITPSQSCLTSPARTTF